MWENGIELGSILAALLMGGIFYRRMGTAFRIVVVQVAVWTFFYALMYGTIQWQKARGIQPDNRWLMNIHMVAETVLLAWASALFRPGRRARVMAMGALGVFFAVWVTQAVTDGFRNYLNYADVAECLLLSLLYGILLYEVAVEHTGVWWASPQIVLFLALLVYFACSVPYMTMMRHLQENHPELNHNLFNYISNVLANIRYLFTALAFGLAGRHIAQPTPTR